MVRIPTSFPFSVIGIPDKKWGERPLAVVVLKEEYREKIDEGELKEYFMRFVRDGTIPKYGVPNRIVIADSIAKTSVGKINKKELRKQYT